MWGVRGEPARIKARTNNRSWPASAVPPQKTAAGQDRASTGGCVKADLGVGQSEAAPYQYNQRGRTKGLTGAERNGLRNEHVCRERQCALKCERSDSEESTLKLSAGAEW